MDSKVEIKIPEQLIGDTVRAELVGALQKHGGGETWVKTIVEYALRKETEYGRSNVFRDAINAMILDAAKQAMGDWIEANKQVIHKALITAMDKQKKQNMKALVDSLIAGLATVTPRVQLLIDGHESSNWCNKCGRGHVTDK